MHCLICSGTTAVHDHATVLGKHQATYLRCNSCGLVFVEKPHWLEEAYRQSIVAQDVGIVDRNRRFCRATGAILEMFLKPGGECLDFAGGYGLFVRMMRDAGYSFYWSDLHSENLFARGFESKNTQSFELTTAFEVFEHLTAPNETFGEILKHSSNVLISTEVLPGSTPPKVSDWWYYSPHQGQHIVFYTVKALQVLAQKHGMHLATNGRNLHFFTKVPIHSVLFKVIASNRFSQIFSWAKKRESLIAKDYQLLSGHALK